MGPSENKNAALKYLGKNWVMALILTLPVLFVIPRPKQYKTTVELTGNKAGNKIFYDDLNNDGNSEKIEIRAYTKLQNAPSIFVEENGKVLYEWITKGYIAQYQSSISGDYNHDGYKEVYLITYDNDSVFLSGVNPFKKEIIINRKFITRFKYFQDNNGLNIAQLLMADLNGDGFQELVIFIYSGFAYTNRKVVAYDLKNDILNFSPKSGWEILWNLNFYDWDHDSLPEFTGGFPAWGNCTEPNYPYTDSIAWLMVLDNDLSFMFDPVPVGRYSSELDVVPFKYGNMVTLAVLYNYNGINDSSYIALFTPFGKLLKKRYITVPGLRRFVLFSDPDQDYRKLYLMGTEIQQLDSSLNVVKSIKLSYVSQVRRLDVDGDGMKEYLVPDRIKNRFVIYRRNFTHPADIDIPLTGGPMHVSLIKQANYPVKIFMQIIPDTYIISYSHNKLYLIQWIFIPFSMFMFLYLVIFGIGRIQHTILQQRYKDERRITKLQIKAIKNQIDPHFTLNMVNAIGSLFMRKETDQAYEVFTRYSRMLQSTINSSEKIVISLYKELDYVRNYLEIQQFRLENKFTYNINIAKGINTDKIKIPRMLVYTFIENSVKHGIAPLRGKGRIVIEVLQEKSMTVITITDNGIGIKQAGQHPTYGTGKGLIILDEIIELFYKLENTRIHYELADGDAGGTVARIYIPVGSR